MTNHKHQIPNKSQKANIQIPNASHFGACRATASKAFGLIVWYLVLGIYLCFVIWILEFRGQADGVT
jgi:hypothetical protein